MLLIDCPYCGKRPELEFVNAGEAHIQRPENPGTLSDKEWGRFLFYRRNPKGLHKERWLHAHGCTKFFYALRDTQSETFLATYKFGESPPAGSLGAGANK